jgi:hypothetical protein
MFGQRASDGTHHLVPVMTVYLPGNQPGDVIEVRAAVSGRAWNPKGNP